MSRRGVGDALTVPDGTTFPLTYRYVPIFGSEQTTVNVDRGFAEPRLVGPPVNLSNAHHMSACMGVPHYPDKVLSTSSYS